MEFRISISPVGGSVICFEHERMRFWWVKTQLGSPGSIVVQCTSGFMIYETRDTVFYRDIQTPRRELKKVSGKPMKHCLEFLIETKTKEQKRRSKIVKIYAN